jgi:hypothetical protein
MYYRTEFHETWWSYRYMFLVDLKVFRFVVKGVKAIFLGVQQVHGARKERRITRTRIIIIIIIILRNGAKTISLQTLWET